MTHPTISNQSSRSRDGGGNEDQSTTQRLVMQQFESKEGQSASSIVQESEKDNPHTDFQLPGLSSHGLASLIVAIAFAYSGRWNPRRLEHYFHGFWDQVLANLVSDLAPNTTVIPQFQFDLVDGSPITPNDSVVTTPEPNAKEVTPDFSIAMLYLSRRHDLVAPLTSSTLTFDSWSDFKVTAMQIPLIAELKRPPSRHMKSRYEFEQDLRVQISAAKRDSLKQAEHAFLAQPGVNTIVLLVCCGEWWSWMMATRDRHVQESFELPGPIKPGENKDTKPEANDVTSNHSISGHDSSSDRDSTSNDDTTQNPNSRIRKYLARLKKRYVPGLYKERSPSPLSDSDKVAYNLPQESPDHEEEGFKRYTDLEKMETVRPRAQDAMSLNRWSFPILFGSGASAQHFFLVHRFLETQWTELPVRFEEDEDGTEDEENEDGSEGEGDKDDNNSGADAEDEDGYNTGDDEDSLYI